MPRNVWQPGDHPGGLPRGFFTRDGKPCKPVRLWGHGMRFQDEEGNLHQRSEVHLQVVGAQRKMNPGKKKQLCQSGSKYGGVLYWPVGQWAGGEIR